MIKKFVLCWHKRVELQNQNKITTSTCEFPQGVVGASRLDKTIDVLRAEHGHGVRLVVVVRIPPVGCEDLHELLENFVVVCVAEGHHAKPPVRVENFIPMVVRIDEK